MKALSRRRLAFHFTILCLIICNVSQAQTDRLNDDLRGPRPEDPFPIHSFQFGAAALGLTTLGASRDSIGFAQFTAGYFVLDNLSVNAELGLGVRYFDHDEHVIRAFDGLFLGRWHYLQLRRFSTFVEAGVGGMHTDGRFAHLGRDDDVLLMAGAGLTYRIAYNVHLTANARYTHISSDSFRGRGSSSTEAIQYGVGVTIVK